MGCGSIVIIKLNSTQVASLQSQLESKEKVCGWLVGWLVGWLLVQNCFRILLSCHNLISLFFFQEARAADKAGRTADRNLQQATMERDVLKKQLEEMEAKVNDQLDIEAQLHSLEV